MSSNREEFVSEIYVNDEQAKDAMAELTAEVDKTARAYEKLLNTKDADAKKTERARKAWESAKQSLANAQKGTELYRTALDNLSGKSMQNLLRMQRQIKSELNKTKPNTAEWNELAKAYQNVSSRIKSLNDAQRSITTNNGKLANGIKGLIGGFNKWGIAIMAIPMAINKVAGALRGVIDVTKQVVNASQTMGDKWNNGMAAMKTTTEAFFMALSSGDWSAFNDGISAALKNARDLAETMDLLASYAISADYMRSEYLTSFQEHLNNARDTGLTEEERQAELEAAKADMEAYNQTITEMADVTRESLIKEFKAVKGIDYTGDIQGFDAFFDELYKKVIVGGNNMVAEAKKKLQDLTAEIQNEGHWEYYASEKGMERVWVGVDKATASMRALKAVTEEYGEDVVNLARASELSDDELKSLLERYQQAKSSEKEVLTLERQLTRTRNSLYSTKPVDAYAESIKKIDKALEAQKLIWKRLYANGLIDKQLYEARIAEVEEDFLKQKMATAEKYGKDTDQFMSQLLDRQIARMAKAKAMLKEEMDEMEKYYSNLSKEDEDRFGINNPNRGKSNKELEAEALQPKDDFEAAIWQKAAEIRASITEESAMQRYEIEMKWLNKLHKDGLLSDEEFGRAEMNLKLGFAAKIAQETNNITQMASDFVTALKEAETQKLEAEYQAQLTAAGDNAEQRQQIEADYEKKKLDLQKKYADVDMAINIAKAVAAGALAAVEAFAAAGGNPVLGAVFAALIAITTAAEVASIIAQRNAIKNMSVNSTGSSSVKTGSRTMTGYAEGGFTEDHTTVTTVGERGKEWVAPHWMVQKNPTTFRNLERYRKSGSHGRSGSIGRGFADGGFTEPASKTLENASFSISDIEAAVETAIIRSMAVGAIRAFLVRKDLTELDNQTERFKDQLTR